MQKYFIAFAMLLAIGAGCTTSLDLGNNDNPTNGTTTDDVAICQNTCGNDSCDEIVCQGSGCPCAETADSCPQDCSAGNDVIVDDEAMISDLIVVSAPMINAEVNSPVTVTGEARGYWFFEASFPIKVYDASNTLLGTGIATAQGEWMTEEFVPFTATVTFSAPATTTGTIVLEKDNPSGLPENDNSLSIPVMF